ncbi:tetratricopeptide repeat protein [Paraglaciecola arctica]|uniref:Tetratricopeptide repeat protein n=1 Tax=Paraglaciecola arctica BSs20135 TaxID=493475 RepID=K6Z8F2_9ALTE|nr:tetratricopeptide repeat protein [Paraglaciecola arctica]GAC19730.1 hypothetical protein GARC_2765 [Paraglaciecola arctica BSs20135]
MKTYLIKALAIASILTSQFLAAASLDKAEMLLLHGLENDAKLELVNVIVSGKNKSQEAQALYILGSIAFNNSNISVALETWGKLIKNHPNSKEAILVKDRIAVLSEIVGESSKEELNNAIATSYLKHGDFWSKGRKNTVTIDSSWMKGFEAALKWYDKTITEFPNSIASKVAYKSKFKTLLGWTDRGKYGSSFGLELDFGKYMPMLLETFNGLEKEHPKASVLQGFRYQIAQAYWGEKDFPKTREWLNKIIKISDGKDTFYSDAAKRRLEKVEY